MARLPPPPAPAQGQWQEPGQAAGGGGEESARHHYNYDDGEHGADSLYVARAAWLDDICGGGQGGNADSRRQ